jgi:hypothetical protein
MLPAPLSLLLPSLFPSLTSLYLILLSSFSLSKLHHPLFSLLFLSHLPVLPPSLVCTQPPFFCFLFCHAQFLIIPTSPFSLSLLHQSPSTFSCLLSPSLNSSLFFSLLFLYPFPVLPPSLVCTQPPFFCFLFHHAPCSIIPPSSFSLSLFHQPPFFFYCLLYFLFYSFFSLPCYPSFFSLYTQPPFFCFLLRHAPFSIIPPSPFSLSLFHQSPSPFSCLLSPFFLLLPSPCSHFLPTSLSSRLLSSSHKCCNII